MTRTRILPNSIGTVNPDGGDPQFVVMSIRQRIKDWGNHLVLVSDKGTVHVRRADDSRCDMLQRQYPEMVVGYFDHRAESAHLLDSIVSVYNEQQPRQAAA